MREESGIVYSLLNKNGYFIDPIQNDNNFTILQDYPIYNFNFMPDDDAKLYTYTYMTPAKEYSYDILSKDYICIDGHECVSLTIQLYDFNYFYVDEKLYYEEQKIIEGIGAVNNGCLHYHELADKPTKMWLYNHFCGVYDLEGNTIYGKPDDCIAYSDMIDSVDSKLNMIIYSLSNITFNGEYEELSLSLYDLNGKLIIKSLGTQNVNISTNEIPPGIYLLSAYSETTGMINKKIRID